MRVHYLLTSCCECQSRHARRSERSGRCSSVGQSGYVWSETRAYERRYAPHPVAVPLIKSQRSSLCCSARAAVVSSIFEYVTSGPSRGQVIR